MGHLVDHSGGDALNGPECSTQNCHQEAVYSVEFMQLACETHVEQYEYPMRLKKYPPEFEEWFDDEM